MLVFILGAICRDVWGYAWVLIYEFKYYEKMEPITTIVKCE